MSENLIIKRKVHVVGVSFENEDGTSRQEIIANLAEEFSDTFFLDVELQEYFYHDLPAYYVLLSGKIVGNLPQNVAIEVFELIHNQGYTVWAENAWFIGGPDGDEDPECALKYGVMIILCILSPQSKTEFLNELDAKYSRNKRQERPEKKKKQRQGTLRFVFGGIYTLFGLLHFGRDTAQMVVSLVIGFALLLWGLSAYMKYKDSLNDKEK